MASYHITATRRGNIFYFCYSLCLAQYISQNHMVVFLWRHSIGLNEDIVLTKRHESRCNLCFPASETVHLFCNVLPSPQSRTVQCVLRHDLSKLDFSARCFYQFLQGSFFFPPLVLAMLKHLKSESLCVERDFCKRGGEKRQIKNQVVSDRRREGGGALNRYNYCPFHLPFN